MEEQDSRLQCSDVVGEAKGSLTPNLHTSPVCRIVALSK